MVCANHQATVDPPLVPAFLPRGDSWSMAKSEYFEKQDLIKWVMTSYHAFPVVRHSPDRRALRRALEILGSGQVLVMYPEGTRVAEGGLKRAQPGVGYLARRAGVPVQPVALLGTRDCLPKGARWPRRARVELRFGPAFRVRRRRPDGRPVDNQEAADAIMLAIAEQLPAEVRGEYADLEGLRERLAGVTEPA